jgi:hypothetical protein
VVPVLLQLLPPSASLTAEAASLHSWNPAPADSSSSSSQAKASAAMLAVVLARSLVQLADAMEAAGPQLLFASLMAKPRYRGCSAACEKGLNREYWSKQVEPFGSSEQHSVEGQWQYWQGSVVTAFSSVAAAFGCLGAAPAAANTAAPAPGSSEAAPCVEVAAEAAADNSCRLNSDSTPSCCSAACSSVQVTAHSTEEATQTSATSSSSSSQHVKWGHLLRLQQLSPQWAAAAAAFCAKQLERGERETGQLPSTAAAAEQLGQQYVEAIDLCRTLAAVAPVTAVCNNPSCDNLGGVSEAAAACKACAGCKCRYCSVTCQRADWKRHKSACRRMAAAGMTCASGCVL